MLFWVSDMSQPPPQFWFCVFVYFSFAYLFRAFVSDFYVLYTTHPPPLPCFPLLPTLPLDDELLAAISKLKIGDKSSEALGLLALAVARGLKKPKRSHAYLAKKARKKRAKRKGEADSDKLEMRIAKSAQAKAKKELAKHAY